MRGKFLCSIIQFVCFFVGLLKRKSWENALEFEENPRTMSLRELLYFTYKYYYRPPLASSEESVVQHFIKPKENEEKFELLLTISIGGDLMPYEFIQPDNTQHLWDTVGADFFGSDIVFANLETPLDKNRKPSTVPEVMLNDMYFNTNETTFGIFNGNGFYKGFDILSIVNNHSMDMGEQGLKSTIDNLNAKGIKTVGAKKMETDRDYEIIEINGIRIGFVAYTYSLNVFLPPLGKEWMLNILPLNTRECKIEVIEQQVRACRRAGAELIICSMHCGNAYQAYPSKQTIELYQRIFNSCGVDVIAGGHPHNLQPWQSYEFKDPFSGKMKKGFAIYSLADFIAYDIFTWCHLCAYLKLEIGRNKNGEIVFKPIVRPMVMLRERKMLKLMYAETVLNAPELTDELRDIKLLYDLCMQ